MFLSDYVNKLLLVVLFYQIQLNLNWCSQAAGKELYNQMKPKKVKDITEWDKISRDKTGQGKRVREKTGQERTEHVRQDEETHMLGGAWQGNAEVR